MFTGIVQSKGRVAGIDRNAFGARLTIDRRAWSPEIYKPVHGDSVCVSGVCLTVVKISNTELCFDVIAETLAKSKLGQLQLGSEVNLEGSLTLSTPLGGHFMQGHIDGVGRVSEIKNTPEEWRLTITPAAELMDFIVPKGSIAIDGVSLTLAAVTATTFTVALIPTTLNITTLGAMKVGDIVNLEADVLAKTVVNYLKRIGITGDAKNHAVTLEKLLASGIISKSM